MQELIKLNYENDRITVSARDLHSFLEVTERFSSWFDRMKQYGFEEGVDFTSVKNFTLVNNGAQRELQDYQLTLDMGKEIAMIQRNEKGKQMRQYFLEVERRWNSPEYVMKRALDYANKQVETLMLENKEMKPKAIFADAVSASHNSILVGQLAKMIRQNGYNIGQNRLFQWLRDNDYLMRRGSDKNMPTQKSMEMGLFEIKETVITNPDNSIITKKTTKVTGKGQIYFVNKFCGNRLNIN